MFDCCDPDQHQMFPLTLGANIGTTVTALVAASVAENVSALKVALAHFFFNITGILIWYPIPFMRRVPIEAAKALGMATKWWRGFPFLYIAMMFFLLPLVLLGVSSLISNRSAGFKALGIIIVVFLGFGLIHFIYWWQFRDGRNKTQQTFVGRQRRREAMDNLPDDIEFIKNELVRLREHTLLCDPDEDGALVEKVEETDEEGSLAEAVHVREEGNV